MSARSTKPFVGLDVEPTILPPTSAAACPFGASKRARSTTGSCQQPSAGGSPWGTATLPDACAALALEAVASGAAAAPGPAPDPLAPGAVSPELGAGSRVALR